MDEALIECLEKKDLEYITVKEICEKAGVNRSTFYLHYETIADLLNECVEYTNNKCFQRYASELADVKKRLASENPGDLIFISPEYLRPYFEFVRENRRLYQVVLLLRIFFARRGPFKVCLKASFLPLWTNFSSQNRKSPTSFISILAGSPPS